jgi:hypothetical protein
MFGVVIDEMKSNYVTNLREVFDLLGDEAKKHRWLLSSYDCSNYPSTKIPFAEPYVWLDGDELVNILEEHEIPFAWCVATAYTKEISLKEVLKYPLPYADGYERFWKPDVTMQNPLADIEIVAWDSTLLIIITRSKEIIEKFANEYPASTDLAEYSCWD